MDSDSLQNALKLLVGFRFNPTDQILMEHYLYNKVHSLPYSSLVVFDCDLYGDREPWEIWSSYGGVDGQDLYLFTKLKRSVNTSGHISAHINRKIGLAGGTWSAENSATPISGRDVPIIGYCKRLRYENPQLLEHHGEWIMHEYSLHESVIIPGYSDPNYILCRIRKNERPKRRAQKICNIQPTKRRILAPKINDMGKNNMRRPTRKSNKRHFSSELQLVEPRVVAPSMIYNMPSTNQITTNVSYLTLLTTDQDTSNMPYEDEIAINESTSDMPYVHNMTINQDISSMPYEAEIAINESTGDIPYVHNMTIYQSTSDDVSCLPETATNQGTNGLPDDPEITINKNTYDVPCVQNMTTTESTNGVSCMPEITTIESTNGVHCMPEITTNTMEPTDNFEWINEILDFSDTKYSDLADLSLSDEEWDGKFDL